MLDADRQEWLATLADVLGDDPALSDRMLRLVNDAWPHLDTAARVSIVDRILTPEYRAVLDAKVAARRK